MAKEIKESTKKLIKKYENANVTPEFIAYWEKQGFFEELRP